MKNISQHFFKLSLIAIVFIVIGVAGVAIVGYHDRTITIEGVTDAAGVNQVSIRTSNQSVRIHHTTGNQARVVSSGMPPHATLIAEVVDGVLMIETRIPRQIHIGINFGAIRHLIDSPPGLDVYLPMEIYERVTIHSTNGRIEMSDFEIADLHIETTNARIEVHDINGNVNLRTTNGRITASSITGEDLRFRTSNGRIEISDLVGDIDAQTTNGRITFNNETIEQQVSLQSSNGRIEVALSRTPTDVAFNLNTTNGRTTIFGNNNSTQQFGDGSYEVTLRTTNGRITVE